MAQQQADLSGLREGAVVLFRSFGLSFSDGMNALMDDWEKNPSAETQAAIDELEAGKGVRFESMDDFKRSLDGGGDLGKAMAAIGQRYGLTNEDVLAFEQAMEDTRHKEQAVPLRI
jgi:hydroxymethylpyrimidine pyrophosphatase-like HAD family hydrolase